MSEEEETDTGREEMTELLNGAVNLATEALQQETEFSPFALARRVEDGELIHIEPEAAVEDGLEVITLLEAGLREAVAQGEYVATAIVSDVTLEDEEGERVSAAIRVALEHADIQPLTCMVPYEIGDEDVELSDLVAEPGETHVFRAPDDN